MSTAATVNAASAAPGEVTVLAPGPLFPAATTNSAPVAVDRSLTAWLKGSVPSVGASVPRLIETIRARSDVVAHSIPSMIEDSEPEPPSPRTLPMTRPAPGATPLYFPAAAAPEPAMVEATWVPCPWPSLTVSPATKLLAATTFPVRSAWVSSKPVSRTATFTPLPSWPARHASGAPIIGTL